MDKELLAEHAKDIVATTGCPSGEIQTYLRMGEYEKAKRAAEKEKAGVEGAEKGSVASDPKAGDALEEVTKGTEQVSLQTS